MKKRRRARTQWTQEMEALLGTLVDRELAEKLGISSVAVGFRRRLLKIPAHKEKKTPQRMFWTTEMRSLLHKIDDEELAKLFGLTVGAVRMKRGLLGIPNPKAKRRKR